MTRTWGHCLSCDQLVRIVPGPLKGSGRQNYWFPVRHKRADGSDCDGHERGI